MLNLYVQLFGIGLLWVTFHCAGMCGPIMAGLVTYHTITPRHATPHTRWLVRARGVLGYQAGRALTYALLGALAGGFGQTVGEHLHAFGGWMTIACALVIVLIALYKLMPWRGGQTPGGSLWAAQGRWLGSVMRRISGVLPVRGAKKMALFGAIMGLLPCMLMYWVLNLAVASQSMFHGAALMLGLVVMTTPVLLMAGCSTSWIPVRWRQRGEKLVPIGLLLSGAWMALIGAATQGYIAHVHLPFRLDGELYTFMLW